MTTHEIIRVALLHGGCDVKTRQYVQTVPVNLYYVKSIAVVFASRSSPNSQRLTQLLHRWGLSSLTREVGDLQHKLLPRRDVDTCPKQKQTVVTAKPCFRRELGGEEAWAFRGRSMPSPSAPVASPLTMLCNKISRPVSRVGTYRLVTKLTLRRLVR